MRVVVAVGGNALLARSEQPDAEIQLHHVQAAAHSLVALTPRHELVICHGNGPQVGLLARESDTDPALSRPYPLDVLGAQTQGMIGYWLVQALRNAGLTGPVVSLVTQTVVDPSDPAFEAPTKLIGPVYAQLEARRLASRYGWSVAPDGELWRRVVPSPDPLRLVEQQSIDLLVGSGTTVVCAGGGGTPVVQRPDGSLHGVEAVVDKDLTAALLAVAVRADRLLILTDTAGVMRDFGTARATVLRHLDLKQLADMSFPAGSMGPKIEACRRFVEATGQVAVIGALTDAGRLLDGTAGTTVSGAEPADPDRASRRSADRTGQGG